MEPIAQLPDPLVVMALPLESQGVFERENIPVLYTGIGKVNAAYQLTRKLAEYRRFDRPLPRVLNFGTSGSRSLATGALVACNIFIQRDMDVSALGFSAGATPYEDIPAQLEFPRAFPTMPQATCGSGDSFAVTPTALACDVVDMEAYALAKVCWFEQARFACVKYVTDGADHQAANDWQGNLHKAADEFLRVYIEVTRSR